MTAAPRKSRLWLWLGGLLVALLLGAVFTLGSLKSPLDPSNATEVLILYAVSTFLVTALIIFSLVLLRSFVRLWTERRQGQLGARFRTKMVLGALTISLLPVVFMFVTSYMLVNHSLSRWFPESLEDAAQESEKLVNELGGREQQRLAEYARITVQRLGANPSSQSVNALLDSYGPAIDGILVTDAQGHVTASATSLPLSRTVPPQPDRQLPSGATVYKAGDAYLYEGKAPLQGGAGSVIVLRRITADAVQRPDNIQQDLLKYGQLKRLYRAFKTQVLLELSLFTVALLFALTWFALYLSKQVTIPIKALAEGTREVSRGNFDYRVDPTAKDELGVLVSSFNNMTSQLADSRRQIDEFTRNLQTALQEIEQRRKLLEAVLENIPTGVISLDADGRVIRLNRPAYRIFGESSHGAKTMDDVAGSAAPEFRVLLRRALRLGTVTKEFELQLDQRLVHAAVTVSALGPGSANPGYIIVVDDLTELLRAQKLAAWQEVAQRIAHEIKNPLTPIQLSSDRLLHFLDKRSEDVAPHRDPELEALATDCANSIGREVHALKSLVDEFSRFVRFPRAHLALADANSIVSDALAVFHDRLQGITVRTDFAHSLPPVKADAELLRGVIVNLIDNAAEALEGSKVKELALSTRAAENGDALEIVVADTGCGISPDDKDRLFLPHFSTKRRGTGLGLAIAARVASEHHGTLRVEDNLPLGSRFILRLPAAESAAVPVVTEN